MGRNVNIKLNLANYATKSDFKKVTGVDTSEFAKQTNWASLKLDVDELDNLKLYSK